MTTQELFDRVAGHLLTQKVQSTSMTGFCAYRGTEGLTCAVGCLIDADHYINELEGRLADSQLVLAAVEGSLGRTLCDAEIKLLRRLQEVHDSNTEYWHERLLGVAADFDLTLKEPCHEPVEV